MATSCRGINSGDPWSPGGDAAHGSPCADSMQNCSIVCLIEHSSPNLQQIWRRGPRRAISIQACSLMDLDRLCFTKHPCSGIGETCRTPLMRTHEAGAVYCSRDFRRSDRLDCRRYRRAARTAGTPRAALKRIRHHLTLMESHVINHQ